MYAPHDSTTLSGPEQALHSSVTSLASNWAQGRRRVTPWAYAHMRALGALRLTIGVFLVVVGALLISHGDAGWASIPLMGAALHFALGSLDTAGAHALRHRA